MAVAEMQPLVNEAGPEVCATFAIGVLPESIRRMLLPRFVRGAANAVTRLVGLSERFAQDILSACWKR